MITAGEVLHYSRTRLRATCSLDDINEIVWAEFNDCLGMDFFNKLESNLVDYSDAEIWEDKSYVEGDKVVYRERYYIANTDTDNEPTLSDDWSEGEKFKTKCYNDLWCNVLARYLALSVMRFSAIEANTPMTDSGIVEQFGDNFKSASDSRVKMYLRDLDRKRETAFNRLKNYMTRYNNNGCFNLFKGLAIGCCGNCGYIECSCSSDNKKSGNFFLAV